MGSPTNVTLEDVRQLGADLVPQRESQGARNAAGVLGDALVAAPDAPPEELLELRSALVRTRAEWELVEDADLLVHARSVLQAAKRLAIAL